MRVVVLTALLIASHAAHAQSAPQLQPKTTDLTIFGIGFNSNVSVSECPLSKHPGILGYPDYKNAHFAEGPESCYVQIMRDTGKPLQDGSKISFVYPLGKEPSLGRLSATLAGGKLVYMEIETKGIRTQAYDLSALVEKFGPPTTLSQPNVQNRMGANFSTIQAEWRLQNGIRASFNSALGSIDAGIVIIGTDQGFAVEKERHEGVMKSLSGTSL